MFHLKITSGKRRDNLVVFFVGFFPAKLIWLRQDFNTSAKEVPGRGTWLVLVLGCGELGSLA